MSNARRSSKVWCVWYYGRYVPGAIGCRKRLTRCCGCDKIELPKTPVLSRSSAPRWLICPAADSGKPWYDHDEFCWERSTFLVLAELHDVRILRRFSFQLSSSILNFRCSRTQFSLSWNSHKTLQSRYATPDTNLGDWVFGHADKNEFGKIVAASSVYFTFT